MPFLVQYPLLIICADDNDLALGDMLDPLTRIHSKAILVFTDRDGAQDYRDRHFPGWRFATIPDEPFFAGLLRALPEKVTLVAFDPYRVGTRPAVIPVGEFLPQLS